MAKTILLTGATDGIGRVTADMLAAEGHTLLLHGRSSEKLKVTAEALSAVPGAGTVETYRADFSVMADVDAMAEAVKAKHERIDVLLNNAGVLKTPNTQTADGLDIRFAVNTLAPYRLTEALLPLLGSDSRVISLSSAAQAPVNLQALSAFMPMGDMEAYAQSKLAITLWSRHMAKAHADGPIFIAVNPGSYLASKMVKEGFGMAGNDLRIGADILTRLSLDPAFADKSGQYFDNDRGAFGNPHPDALNPQIAKQVFDAIKAVSGRL